MASRKHPINKKTGIWKYCLLLAFLLPSLVAEAQYTIHTSYDIDMQFDYPMDITIEADELSDALDIGFDFTFFGNTHNEFYVSSNGFVSFNATGGSGYFNQTMPDPTSPNDLIALAWASHDPDYVSASFETLGNAPYRSLRVNFYMEDYGDGGGEGFGSSGYYYVDAQLVLYETTNIIEIHMYDYEGGYNEIQTTQGLENSDGTVAIPVPGRNNTFWDSYTELTRFIPDTYVDLEIFGLIPVQCEGLQDIQVLVENIGGATVDTFYVDWTWKGEPQDSIIVYENLPPNSATLVTLGQKTFESDSMYLLTSWTYNPENQSDQNPLNDTISRTMFTGLQGVYTIGGTSPDYSTIAEAVSALVTHGACDTVVFNIRSGVYTEELDIPYLSIAQGSVVVFQSESGVAEDVTITQNYSSGSGHRMIEITNASHLRFKHLTLQTTGTACSNVVYISSYCADIHITGCHIIGATCNLLTTNGAVISLVNGQKEGFLMDSNIIRNGSYGVHISPGYPSFASEVELLNNTVDSFYRYGIYLYRMETLNMGGNTIFSPSSSSTGIDADYLYGACTIENQNIYLPLGNRGMRLNRYNYLEPASEDTLYVLNNMINLGGAVSGSRAFLLEQSNNVNVWHNTIHSSSTNSSSYGFYSAYNTITDLRNSLITNIGAGRAAYLETLTSDYNVFFNVTTPLISDGTEYSTLADWVLASGQDENSLQEDPLYVSSTDLHVGHGALNNVGDELMPPVAFDIDLDSRNTATPDIGADEFGFLEDDLQAIKILFSNHQIVGDNDVQVVVYNLGQNDVNDFTIEWELNDVVQTPVTVNTTMSVGGGDTITLGTIAFVPGESVVIRANTHLPNGNADSDMTNDTARIGPVYAILNGLYTVGGDTPDFPTLSSAFDAIAFGGIADSIALAVRDGLYADPISLMPNENFSCSKPIHVYSESLDASAVVFDNNNEVVPVIRLDGVSGITFSYMTFKLTPSAFHNTIILENGAACNGFNHCVIEGRFNTASTSNTYAAVLCDSNPGEDNDFYNCVFKYGSFGLYSNGPNSFTGSLVDIVDNSFINNYYYGAYVLNSKHVKVVGNYATITSAQHSNYRGIFLNNCKSMTLSHNAVYNSFGGQYAIGFTECDGTYQDTTRAYNNYVYGGTSNNLIGIFTGSYSNYTHVSNNTVRCYQGRAGGFSWSSNFRIDNNIFVSTDTNGVVLELLNMGGDVVSDNNCLYATAGNIGELNNTQYHTMAEWKALGYDTSSLNIDPIFDDSTFNAHAVLLDSRAIPYAHIADDIEGDARHASEPDLGANEFDPLTADAGIMAIVHPTMPFSAGNQPVYVRFYNNSGDTLESLQFDWEVNGSPQPSFIWDGLLDRGAIYDSLEIGQFEFETYTPYHVKVWVSEPNEMTDQLAINDTIEVANQYTGLSGIYTIGGEEPDFETITDAVDALNAGGADAPVTLNIRNGIYLENILLHDFPGSDCDRPVIFQSESGDSSLVTITNLGIDAYTIVLDGADGVQFKNLTIKSVNTSYRHAIQYGGGAHCNEFEGNSLHGFVSTSTSSTAAVINSLPGLDTANVFINNRILNGSYSFDLAGDASALTNTIISGNLLDPYYYGIYLDDYAGVSISHNKIYVDDRNSSRGITLINSPNLEEISNNVIYVPEGQYGIFMNNCDNVSSSPGRIFNNFISVGGTSIARGIYMTGSAYQDVLHNSILVNSTNVTLSNTMPIHIISSPNVRVFNNATKNAGVGYCIYLSSNSGFLSDHNSFFTAGSTFGYWNGGAVETTFENWQTASTLDSNSIYIDPNFMSSTDLHTFLVLLNETGDPDVGITHDIDGELRDSLPDIGADEFDPLPYDDAGIFMWAGPHSPFAAGNHPVEFVIKNFGGNTLTSATVRWTVNGIEQTPFEWTGNLLTSVCDTFQVGSFDFDELIAYNIDAWSEMPNDSVDGDPDNDLFSTGTFYASLAGTYTVGGFAPDFNLISELETILNSAGIVDHVIFDFRPGEYQEAISISNFPRSSYTHTVTFKSESGDSSDVTITQTASNTVLVDLDDAHKILFNHLTLTNNKGHVFQIRNGSSQITIANNYLETQEPIASSRGLIYSSTTTEDSLSILNNHFHNGYYGVYLYGGDYEKGHVISGNLFTGVFRHCAYVRKFDGLTFSNNQLLATSTVSSDVYMYQGIGAFTVTQNTIISDASNYSLYLGSITNETPNASLFANNYIYKSGTSTSNAVQIEGVEMINIDFNSIYNANDHASSSALFVNNLLDFNIRNNILYGVEGPAIQSFGTPDVHNYNVIFSLGAVTALQHYTPYSTLAAYVAATGTNANSVDVDPLFLSSEAPDVVQYLLDGSGVNIAGLTTDFNGVTRTSPPDIGAVEFTPSSFDVKMSHVVTPEFGCGLSDEENIQIALVNMGSMAATGFDVVFDFDDVVVSENIGSLEVPPGDTLFYTFSATIDASDFGEFSLPVWIEFPSDVNTSNDSIVDSIVNYPPLNIAPGNLNPVDGTSGLENQVSLSWSPVNNSVSYDLYVWPENTAKPITPTHAEITTINKLVTGLTYGVSYWWQVHAISHCDEQLASDTSTFAVRNLPDLIIQSITTPPTAFSEQTIGIEWVTKNIGSGGTVPGTWYEDIYLSPDPTYNSFDPLLASVSSLNSLNADQSYAHSADVVIPQGSNGLYYIIIRTDRYNGVKETLDNNNTTFSASQINIALSPPPDLLVTDITTPLISFSGETINMTYTVSNLGSGITTETIWKDEIRLQPAPGNNNGINTLLATKTHVGALLPDSSYTVSLSVDIPENIFGNYQIQVFTDYKLDVFEFASEGNNTLLSDVMEVVLTPPVDLVPDSLMTPDTMSLYQTYPITFQIKNAGGSAPTVSHSDRYYLSQSPVYNQNFLTHLGYAHHNPGLMPGQYTEKVVNIKLTGNYSDVYYLYLVTDYNDRIDEYAFENNNILRSDPIVIIKPDLVPDSLIHPSMVMSGSTINLRTEIVNDGPGYFYGSYKNRYYLSDDDQLSTMTDIVLSERTISNAELGTTDTVSNSFSLALPQDQFGSKYLIVVTDAHQTVHEANELNNTLASPITIFEAPHPDLLVTSIQVPDTIQAGVPFSMSYALKNQGDAPLTVNTTDSIFLSFSPSWNRMTAVPLMTRQTALLDTSQTLTFNLSIETLFDQNPNEYYIYTLCDATDKIYEGSGESNNITRSDVLALLAYPDIDIAVDTLFGLPDTLTSGQSYSVQYAVSNLSDFPTYHSGWTDRFYFSTDSLFESDSDMLLSSVAYSGGVIDSGATKIVSSQLTLPDGISGSYYVFVEVDNGDVNDDIDRTNNSNAIRLVGVAKKIPVKLALYPDLQPTSFICPVEVVSGQYFDIIATVTNAGLGMAGIRTDKIFVSSNNVIDQGDKTLSSLSKAPLGSMMTQTDTLSVFVPANYSGNYYIIYSVDHGNIVYEHLKDNNNIFLASIVATPPPPADLIVRNILVPDSVLAGESASITWETKNTGTNPASGALREIVYLSADTTWNLTDEVIGIWDGNVNLGPGANTTKTVSLPYNNVNNADYHTIILTDARNNIPESNEDNNYGYSFDLTNVDIKELFFDFPEETLLSANVNRYYKLLVNAEEAGRNILITLEGDSLIGVNQMYVKYEAVPTPADNDYSYSQPFSSHQQIMIRNAEPGYYYIMINGFKVGDNSPQPVTVLARTLLMEILSVTPNEGGDKGYTTIEAFGSELDSIVVVKLVRADTLQEYYEIVADTFIMIDEGSRVIARFNLSGQPLGEYHLLCHRESIWMASYNNAFAIIEGQGSEIQVHWDFNPKVYNPRSTTLFQIKIDVENTGDSDAIDRYIRVGSPAYDNPMYYSLSDYYNGIVHTQLVLSTEDVNGFPGILRPGGRRTFYVIGRIEGTQGFSIHYDK